MGKGVSAVVVASPLCCRPSKRFSSAILWLLPFPLRPLARATPHRHTPTHKPGTVRASLERETEGCLTRRVPYPSSILHLFKVFLVNRGEAAAVLIPLTRPKTVFLVAEENQQLSDGTGLQFNPRWLDWDSVCLNSSVLQMFQSILHSSCGIVCIWFHPSIITICKYVSVTTK